MKKAHNILFFLCVNMMIFVQMIYATPQYAPASNNEYGGRTTTRHFSSADEQYTKHGWNIAQYKYDNKGKIREKNMVNEAGDWEKNVFSTTGKHLFSESHTPIGQIISFFDSNDLLCTEEHYYPSGVIGFTHFRPTGTIEKLWVYYTDGSVEYSIFDETEQLHHKYISDASGEKHEEWYDHQGRITKRSTTDLTNNIQTQFFKYRKNIIHQDGSKEIRYFDENNVLSRKTIIFPDDMIETSYYSLHGTCTHTERYIHGQKEILYYAPSEKITKREILFPSGEKLIETYSYKKIIKHSDTEQEILYFDTQDRIIKKELYENGVLIDHRKKNQ